MSRKCDLSGKGRQANHKISHSNIKTRKFSEANLKTKKIFDPETGRTIRPALGPARGLHRGGAVEFACAELLSRSD